MRLNEKQLVRLGTMRNSAAEINKFGGNPALYWAQHLSAAVEKVLTSLDNQKMDLADLVWLKTMNEEYNANPARIRNSESL